MEEIAATAEVVECFGIHFNDKLIRSFVLSYLYSFLCWWYYAVRAATNVLKVVKSKKSAYILELVHTAIQKHHVNNF